jgi:fumarate hydratase subunit beta
MKKITLPLTDKIIKDLSAGEQVLLSGEIITGRDAAHKKFFQLIEEGKGLPFDIKGKTIYYTGPCPKKEGEVIGSCGPTTSGRMDFYTPKLLETGLKGMIGKGQRSREVTESIIKNGAVYFAAIGGAGALYSRHVTSAKVLCFEELLSEAVHILTVKDFPVIVAIDCKGNDIYG